MSILPSQFGSEGIGGQTMRPTFRRFFETVETGKLVEPFDVLQAKKATGLPWVGSFLAKHRVGNRGGNTELFMRVRTAPVRYRISRLKLAPHLPRTAFALLRFGAF